jgi:2-polyprenyl-3-methyl-5-hydroxy-6-metoxy-1,4-benzoquinol methylase
MSTENRRAHWERVYGTKSPESVSWRQERPAVSLRMIEELALPMDAAILDVGAGATTLIDALLAQGHTDITALDVSEAALAHIRARIESDVRVHFEVADITCWRPARRYALWHDRAVLHFLIDAADQTAYAETLRNALAPDGHAIISGFAPGGPERCSGLPVVQHDALTLSKLLGNEFVLMDVQDETHATPSGSTQAFRYFAFKRV